MRQIILFTSSNRVLKTHATASGRIKFALSLFFVCVIMFSAGCADNARRLDDAKRLFVFDKETGVITEYGVEDFKVKQTLQIPKDLYFLKTESYLISKGLLISKSGKVLYYDDEFRDDLETSVIRRLWYRDGKKEFRSETFKKLGCFPSDGECSKTDDITSPDIDAGEAVFYWGINRVVRYFEGRITLEFELYRIHFDESSGKLVEERIAEVPFSECECATGVCSESCPFGYIEAPEGGIKDFIKIAHFVQGQLESRMEGYTYFEKRGAKWVMSDVDKKFKSPFVQTVLDSGCCGWVNESNDILSVIDGEEEELIYDEWGRFNNHNYDISFYPLHGELSPDLSNIAYTIEADSWALSDYKKTGTFRLSADGKEDPDGLEKIKTVVDDLPMVEITPVNKKTGSAIVIKKAELGGWIDNNTVLLLKDGNLGIFDITSQQFKKSPVSVKSLEQVFLR